MFSSCCDKDSAISRTGRMFFFMSRMNVLKTTMALAKLQRLVQDSPRALSSHPTLGISVKRILEEPLAHE
jgi:hypothetical protein